MLGITVDVTTVYQLDHAVGGRHHARLDVRGLDVAGEVFLILKYLMLGYDPRTSSFAPVGLNA
jgi:hypothetical protein